MQFVITVEIGGKQFRMQVDRYWNGDSVDKYKVSAGGREIHLQSNIPELKKQPRKKISWKIISGDFSSSSGDDAAFALQRIFRAIEEEVHKK